MTHAHVALLLAYTPFIDPIDAHRYWFLLLIPMALGVSIAYKAVRLNDLSRFWRQVGIMTVQIIGGIVALGAAGFVVIQYLLPAVAPLR
jgi:undecaprenyl pyrophosphate phosphatase UppP